MTQVSHCTSTSNSRLLKPSLSIRKSHTQCHSIVVCGDERLELLITRIQVGVQLHIRVTRSKVPTGKSVSNIPHNILRMWSTYEGVILLRVDFVIGRSNSPLITPIRKYSGPCNVIVVSTDDREVRRSEGHRIRQFELPVLSKYTRVKCNTNTYCVRCA